MSPRRSILIEFVHGLGDNVQLTVVLSHLRKHRPDWDVDVLTQVGKESLFRGQCRAVYVQGREAPPGPYDQEFALGWFENYNAYGDCPNTKVTNCLREEFGLEPDPSLMGYQVAIGPAADARAVAYYRRLGLEPVVEQSRRVFRVVVVHHKGNTSPERKNLTDADLTPLLDLCRDHGYRCVILDWDDRTGPEATDHPAAVICSHRTDPELWLGYGSGDGETIAALVERAAAFVGIDSGPGHVAGATTTPAVLVWTQHHPVMFYDLCPNVVHLVPEHHRQLPPAYHEAVWGYFRDHYTFHTYVYVGSEIARHAAAALRLAPLKSNPMTRSHMLKARNFHAEYYEEHRRAGLDYLGHGEWQESYGRWVVGALAAAGWDVLDVGCACGSICLGMKKAGCRPHGVDLNNHMIGLGRATFPGVPLYVCDAVNLHLFGPGSFGLVHSNQVAEHWRPELVPHILREFWRVLKPGGWVFTVLDTAELFERQGREAEEEDPTNQCVRGLEWWRERFAEAGFADASSGFEAARLKAHPDSFFRRYDWDWLLHRKPEGASDA